MRSSVLPKTLVPAPFDDDGGMLASRRAVSFGGSKFFRTSTGFVWHCSRLKAPVGVESASFSDPPSSASNKRLEDGIARDTSRTELR